MSLRESLSLFFCFILTATFSAQADDAPPPAAPAQPPAAPGPEPAKPAPAPAAPAADAAVPSPDLPGGPLTLDPILITASRYEQRAFDAPFSTDAIDAGEIRDRLYRTTPEAFQYTPGVMVQKTAHGQGSPFIRGFTGFRTLMLIDGVRLNNATFREGPNQYWSTIDPYSIDRFELVKGPSSVLYGSDAIGGTVNALTKNPYGYGPGVGFHGLTYLRGSTAERSFTLRGETSITIEDKFGILIGGTGKWYGDLQAGGGTPTLDNTGYDEWDADVKAEYFFNPDTRLVFAYQRVQQNNVPRTHSTVFAEPFAGSTVGSDRQRDLDNNRELIYLQLHARNVEGAFFDALHASVSWHDQWETEDRVVSNGNRNLASFRDGTFGFSLQLESDTPIGRLTYGIEYYHDNINSGERRSNEAGPRIQGPIADEAAYDLLGLYVQDTIKVDERLELIVGGRFTYAAADADSVTGPEENPVTSDPISVSDDWSSFVGSGRLVYHLVPQQVNLFGGVSQGFRAPNLSDITASKSAASGIFEVAALGLDPEYYVTFEAGVKTQFNQTFGSQAAYFYTIIDDQIIRSPTGETTGGTPDEQIVQGTNSGDGYVHGVEAEAYWRFHPQFTFLGNVTWMEGRVDSFLNVADPSSLERGALSRVQPLTGLVGVRFDDATHTFWAETTVQLAAKADHLSPGDQGDTQRIPPGGTPGWAVWSVRGGVRITKDFSITAAVENITDEDYRIHGSGQNQSGRNFILAGELKF